MKTLVLKASPRQDGNTATMANRFVDGLRDAGHTEVAEFRLNEMTIRPCQACNACLQPPYGGCVLDDDFKTIYPSFREADLVVFAAPVYWWHLCAQMKAFVDRMHPMLTFDREHALPAKDFVLLTAYLAEDPYGIELMIKTFESITGWSGMRLAVVRFHSEFGHVRDCPSKLDEVYALGHSFSTWQTPELTVGCPMEDCGFAFRDESAAALHLVMAADAAHLAWKQNHLSVVHTLQNTAALTEEARRLLQRRA